MSEKELRRSLSVLPIGTVMKLTDLSARQIRYYEEQGLVMPERNDGNRRMYSLNDIDRILEIKDYLDDGLNISGIKEVYKKQQQLEDEKKNHQDTQLTDSDVRRILEDEFLHISGLMPPSSTFNNQKL
ncbi:MerR family transcriptional regulator [Lentilactobacillus sp. SPB1-3]|uniref:MerR family transcriptional regulator n=1 Tax=Lentilactobacillus terminaliae TaxID=3003483 RepID=A0ACD5DBN3_9LACO|nr:MerR family transcriptional regulator [Lentilactobacillus sp. SPB1-3]MCZ0977122.1 MerR family transcriptional regulator [Lentilactobacillus sp. SPB1-3]